MTSRAKSSDLEVTFAITILFSGLLIYCYIKNKDLAEKLAKANERVQKECDLKIIERNGRIASQRRFREYVSNDFEPEDDIVKRTLSQCEDKIYHYNPIAYIEARFLQS
mmetsp:Transcript_2426/g.3338  ORF Transcript_2426/g.3338 Transcript_2426/m.3338 type:complete len:109 (+) Transcript_2426:15-341(+)